jgi:hypothetical protein
MLTEIGRAGRYPVKYQLRPSSHRPTEWKPPNGANLMTRHGRRQHSLSRGTLANHVSIKFPRLKPPYYQKLRPFSLSWTSRPVHFPLQDTMVFPIFNVYLRIPYPPAIPIYWPSSPLTITPRIVGLTHWVLGPQASIKSSPMRKFYHLWLFRVLYYW